MYLLMFCCATKLGNLARSADESFVVLEKVLSEVVSSFKSSEKPYFCDGKAVEDLNKDQDQQG